MTPTAAAPGPGEGLEPHLETILEEAARIVGGDRQASYGTPLANHTVTAALFSAYLDAKYGEKGTLDADDVCWFNILQKCARDAFKPKRDNLVDVAGYARNIELCRAAREVEK